MHIGAVTHEVRGGMQVFEPVLVNYQDFQNQKVTLKLLKHKSTVEVGKIQIRV